MTDLTKFNSLQALRGLAAFAVVVHHTQSSVAHFVGGTPGWLDAVCAYGYLGVDFFFVLSGFIILNSHIDDEKSSRALRAFGFKRFVRIFPPYWPISIALLISYTLLPGMSAGTRSHVSILSSFLLFPDSSPPALKVAWTLIHEMMFYLTFSLFFLSTKIFIAFIATWVVAIGLAAGLLDLSTLNPWAQRFLNPVNLEFVMGMGMALLARRTKPGAALPLLCAAAVLLAILVAAGFTDKSRAPFGLAFAPIVLGVVLLEKSTHLTFPRWLVITGDASYAIYLIHDPLVALASRVTTKLGPLAHWSTGVVLGVAVSLVAGLLYHLVYEKPVTRYLRRTRHQAVAPAAG